MCVCGASVYMPHLIDYMYRPVDLSRCAILDPLVHTNTIFWLFIDASFISAFASVFFRGVQGVNDCS